MNNSVVSNQIADEIGGEPRIRQQEPADHLSSHTRTVNLRGSYPLAHRAVFTRTWRTITSFILLIILLRYGEGIAAFHPQAGSFEQNPLMPLESFEWASYYIFYSSFLFVSLRLLYEEFFHMNYYYGIEADHFVISTGVFLRNRNLVHISHISDIFLRQNFLDFLFCLYSIQIANPSPEAPQHDKISSLSKEYAIGLQDFLVDLVKSTRKRPDVLY